MQTISQNSKSYMQEKIAMLLLALFPLLHWYNIGLPVGLGELLMFLVAVVAFATGRIRYNAIPKSFFFVFAYVSLSWYIQNSNFSLMGLLPGGPIFFFFLITVLAGVSLFNIGYLKTYMRVIVIVSIIIFLFQFIVLQTTGIRFCCVPNLTGSFMYEDLTYASLAERHFVSTNPCAIFLEKSYMAYYLVMYLCLELFHGKGKEVLYTRFSLLIVFVLLILKSGSGILGVFIPIAIKIISFFWEKKNIRIAILITITPFIALMIYLYAITEIGAAMLERQSEITTEGTSGFTRIIYGYSFYENLTPKQQCFGTSVSEINDLIYLSYIDRRFSLNGIQYPLIQLGIIGLSIWILFYVKLFWTGDLCSRSCILVFFLLSSLEVVYLGPYMAILTIIACSQVKKFNSLKIQA